jgi:hypothetical protein
MRKNTATSSSFLFPSNPDGDTFAYERSLKKKGSFKLPELMKLAVAPWPDQLLPVA